jgi:glycosyltransferase involved in cell wall biosynthesis
LLRAFAALRGGEREEQGGARLALVGYGPEEEALRRLATSLHIAPRTHFLGPTATPEKWYKCFSVLCLPSAVEGFGLTLVEAMAGGIPVVAVKTAVTAGIVRDGVDGRLVDMGALGHALQEVMEWAPRPPHGPNGAHNSSLEWVREHFSVEGMVGAHAEFFKNLLATRC